MNKFKKKWGIVYVKKSNYVKCNLQFILSAFPIHYLNGEKCKVIRIERRAARNQYTINDPSNGLSQILDTRDQERALGVIISHDLKPRNKLQKSASKAKSVLALLWNTFIKRSLEEARYDICKTPSGKNFTCLESL